eukprot:6174116-Pleurochrysis_carterae.AAC.3
MATVDSEYGDATGPSLTLDFPIATRRACQKSGNFNSSSAEAADTTDDMNMNCPSHGKGQTTGPLRRCPASSVSSVRGIPKPGARKAARAGAGALQRCWIRRLAPCWAADPCA